MCDLCCTYWSILIEGDLGGCGQSLLHHAGQWVELMLLVNLKQAQKLPLLP